MDPINVITTALATGAGAALKSTAEKAVKETYDGLKFLIQRCFKEKENTQGDMILQSHEQDPTVWAKPLEDALVKADVDKNEDILKAAQKLMEMIEPKQAAMGKFNIQANNVTGVVQAEKIDNLTQTFGK
ncbi:hypothetical protein QUF76_01970 [Desulfobacterales bacterium HSG16]|nr:hypothetical protein [Desulfobacterales bacterium HSG16]